MRFYQFINEAGLGGKSRSGGMSNWDYYMVLSWPKNKIRYIDKNSFLYNDSFTKIIELKKNNEIEISSTDLVKNGPSYFAKVKFKDTEGFVKINDIGKPTSDKSKGVIPGGTASKEFTPYKLDLDGKSFSNKTELSQFVWNNVKKVYSDEKFYDIKEYIKECLNLTGNTNLLFEDYSKTYKIKSDYKINDTDIKILSKNFGEVLLALFILSTNKKVKSIEFPSDVSQKLYDFSIYTNEKMNRKHYYSAKSYGGSSTSVENINVVLSNFSDENPFFNEYKHEIDVIKKLINNKKKGITTIKNIQSFFEIYLPSKVSEIIGVLNKLTPKNKIGNLSQDELSKWFSNMVKTVDEKTFVDEFTKMYATIFSDIEKIKGTTEQVLKQMYNEGDGKKFDNGYLLYPMGSYIVSYLNKTGDYKDVLTKILNFGSFVTQAEILLTTKSIDIKIRPFKTINFRFSYNAGSKYPGNRPIGFIAEK